MIFRNWVLQNFPFIEDDFDALTDYELFSKVLEYMRKSLKKIEDFQKDIDIFSTKLDEFEHYFDNLDVTEEVNAKLDEMVEDGTMEELIAEFLQLTTIYCYNNVNEMKEATNLVNGCFVKTYGFYSYNDGGGAYYKVRNVTTDDVINEMSIISLYNNTVIAELIKNDVNVKQYGAVGDDDNDDTLSIQTCINENIIVKIPKGTYKITNSLNITNHAQKIYGDGTTLSNIKKYGTDTYSETVSYNNVDFDYSEIPCIIALVFSTDTNLSHVEINNIHLISDTNGGNDGILAPHISYCKFEKIRTNKCNIGIRIGGWINKIYNCEILENVDVGLVIKDGIYHVVSGCHAKSISVRNGTGTYINNSAFDNGYPCFTVIDSKSVFINNCSTETYRQVLRNNNSLVNIYGCDFEGHSSTNTTYFQGFFDNTNGGITNISNSNIHYEDYSAIGDPDNKNIVQNAGGTVTLKDNKITTTYTRTNYLTGSSTIIENDKVESTIATVRKKTGLFSVGSNTSVEILRLPFAYGKNYMISVKSWGSMQYHETITLEATMCASANGNETGISDDVNYVVAKPASSSYNAYLHLAKEDNELVLYFKSTNNYSSYNTYFEIEYSSN